jgi:IS605 OrfB family transposase
MKNVNIRTIKIALKVRAKDSEERQRTWKRLYQIFNDSYKAANFIASGQYFNDQFIRKGYARTGVDINNKEEVSKFEAKFKEVFGTQRQASTERDIKEAFPGLPPCVTNPLNQIVYSTYKKEKTEMLRGERSLRSYKANMPVPTTKISVKILQNSIEWSLSHKEKIYFEIYYGQDRGNYFETIEKLLAGKCDYSAPSIQLKDKKLFLLLPIQEPIRTNELDENLSVGVDLGLSIPAYVSLNVGNPHMPIGNKEDFLRTRLQMQARRRRCQKSLARSYGGHGWKRKNKGLDYIESKERNFATQYNHFISKKVVDFALHNRAKHIKLELLEGFSEDYKNNFILRNWSYYQLQNMIEMKAEREGIKVVYIDPYKTSQICSHCGNSEEGQRIDQAHFKCKKCGKEINADYNASLNVSRSMKIVNKKEECEYYRLGHQANGEAGKTGETETLETETSRDPTRALTNFCTHSVVV